MEKNKGLLKQGDKLPAVDLNDNGTPTVESIIGSLDKRIEMAFGDYYKKFENEAGRPENNSLPGVTNKQQAEIEIDKKRKSINKYVRMSDIPDLKMKTIINN